MLRILNVVHVLGLGGSEIFLMREIQRLRERGHFIGLVFCEKRGEKINDFLKRYTDNRDLFQIPYNLRDIVPIIRQVKPHVIHTTQAHPKFLRIAKQLDPKIVCVSSITADLWPADIKFDHRTYTDAIVTAARAFLPGIRSKLKLPSERVEVIENGVDVDFFDPRIPSLPRDASQLTEPLFDATLAPVKILNQKVILQVGRVHPIKNIEASLEIARKVLDKRDDVIFLYAGGRYQGQCEEYWPQMVSRRKELKLSDRYFFIGERSDIRELLAISTCVISTNQVHEGTPNASLEALSMGKPIVAMECEGIHDVVRSGATGFIEKNISYAAEDILRLIDDDSLRIQMSSSSREYALQRFRLDSAIDQYEQLYQDLMINRKDTPLRRARFRAGLVRDHFEEKILTPIFQKH